MYLHFNSTANIRFFLYPNKLLDNLSFFSAHITPNTLLQKGSQAVSPHTASSCPSVPSQAKNGKTDNKKSIFVHRSLMNGLL